MNKVIIIGAGAAGLLAGIAAVNNGAQVVILEKMPKVGRKLLITGKGRCNITNDCTIQELVKNIPGNGKFLYSAFQHFPQTSLIQLLNSNGLATKVERGNRVFPVSDKAMDVVDTLRRCLLKSGGEIYTQCPVEKIITSGSIVREVICSKGRSFQGDAFVLTTGGASYVGTGSSGDGYRFAEELGHTLVPLRPSLIPLVCPLEEIQGLQGLSLKNVTAALEINGKIKGKEFGEMLFTHFGVSGPIILSLSEFIKEGAQQKLHLDLKPALSLDELDKRVQRDFKLYSRKQLLNGMQDLLPQSLIPAIIKAAGLNPKVEINQLTKEQRISLVHTLKDYTLTITGARPLAEAIVTAGGISLKEVQPKTMASKLFPNLFLAGEVLDINGYTGGFNLQAAFSSGFVAGESAAAYHE